MGVGAMPRLVVGFSDGPGLAFGVRLLRSLWTLPVETHLVASATAEFHAERDTPDPTKLRTLADRSYGESNQAARISSGSFLTSGMIVVACSGRSLASIATGYADNLLHRAADVTIKEARPLTVVLRDLDIPHHVQRLAAVPWVEVRTVDETTERDPRVADALIRSILERFVPDAAAWAAATAPESVR